MYKFNLLDFIRSMKKANYKQIRGHLFAVEVDTDDLCGCALGQGLLNLGLLDIDKLKTEVKSGIYQPTLPRQVYDPLTKTWITKQFFVGTGPEVRRAQKILDDIEYTMNLDFDFSSDVVELNDSQGELVGDIAAKMYSKVAAQENR